jgi:hypothetical protein
MSQADKFFISEWEWFKLQLRVSSLENRGSDWITTFSFDENISEPSKVDGYLIRCKIYN